MSLLDSIDPKPAPEGVKLGAHVRTRDPRIPLLARHSNPAVQPPPEVHRSHREFDFGMLGNDNAGDCVIAAKYHQLMHEHLVNGLKVPAITVAEAISEYSEETGYNPSDPSTDQGTDPNASWNHWQTTGLIMPDGTRNKIAGSAQIQPRDGTNIQRGMWEFDSVGLSVALPLTARGQGIWDVVGDPSSDPSAQPGSWGGHEVSGWSYDRHRIAFLSWGQVMMMTWRFWGTYGELGLVAVSHDQIGKGGVSETGVNYDTLVHDLPQL